MLVTAFLILGYAAADAAAKWDGTRFAWYTTDAGDDFKSTLPIGNGRLAAAVYGTGTEKLVLNENSVWSGPWLDRANPNSKDAVPKIREMLISGNITGAGQAALDNMAGNPISPRAYHPLVNLGIDFGHGSGISDYTRWLDTFQGTAAVNYTYHGTSYSREYVASYPHGVLAFRLSADQPGKLNANFSLSRSQWVLSRRASVSDGEGGHTVALSADSGQPSDAITFWSEARIVNSGGNATSDGTTVFITGADTVDVFFDAETSYRHPDADAAQRELKRKLDAAVAAGYPAVRDGAVEDFSSLMGRVRLDLGSSGSAGEQPVPTRLSNFRQDPDADPELMTLVFNFGRHLLAASSRDTGPRSLPANLQGIWNDDYDPPWQSKYTININIEMNYWPALVTNLAETHKPLFDLIDMAIPRGRDVARTMYGCERGFVLHHNTDLWGDAAPVDRGTPYTVWPMGAAWLATHAMEHYRFTRNRTFLAEVAWPVLRETARFYHCYLFEWDSYWTTGPSLSPEHSFIVPPGMTTAGAAEGLDISPEMDNQLLHQLFTDVTEACARLGLFSSSSSDDDDDDAETCTTTAETYLPRIRPPAVHPTTGRIQEWRSPEYADTEPGHRHFSPLWGLYPGRQLLLTRAGSGSGSSASGSDSASANLTTAAAAALLDHRMESGSGSTGWSRAWAAALYARVPGRGRDAWRHARQLVATFLLGNLWNSDSGGDSVFQIDGNFGFVAALAEMLLQSHETAPASMRGSPGNNNRRTGVRQGEQQQQEEEEEKEVFVVHLLPALPGDEVPDGRVDGLVARGGFVVRELVWAGGKFARASVLAQNGVSKTTAFWN
ncbi:glycoside hydrolase family 95 protein [Thermothelomyces thermophilus ATCC 42464]|uniref:Glycoside hydrolase family 95 protein n=1 Tax=Thermothelomyces thermophilus (strain ATCC 42464 / BCRC 31852 / DSM 1799) TaxID=573729 RepID=G2QDI5_THET4|nr:glycoside hydrolase family 95 protein [Thermothelomyces thermophilus ATCC 42464]AEO57497.1 glycoside hydrolase family 95 protein [Thermothelomyces thermophilus ATCC 42464]